MRNRIVALAVLSLLVGSVLAVWSTSRTPSLTPEACVAEPFGATARECYIELLRPSDASGLPVMFTAVEELLADPIAGRHFAVECHEVLHDLGKELESSLGPLDIAVTPAQSCASGFQHGIAEIRLADLSDAELQTAGPTWCVGQEAPVCRHLLGHVAMRRSVALVDTGEIAAPDPSYALAVCSVPDDPARTERENNLDEFRCLDGAYMEWTLWVARTAPATVPEPPERVCLDLRSTSLLLASACTSQIGLLMHGYYPSGPDAVAACSRQFTEVSTSAKQMCVYSVTNSIATLSGDPLAATRALCGPADVDCRVGMVMSLVAARGDDAAEVGCSVVLPDGAGLCLERVLGEYPFEY